MVADEGKGQSVSGGSVPEGSFAPEPPPFLQALPAPQPADRAPSPQPGEPPQALSGRTGVLLGLAKDFALALLLALFVLVFLFQPFRVEGVSMLPQFSDRDRIIVNKLSYRLGEIRRGDVVVFWFPEDPAKSFIKRVIGLPGDRVEIHRGLVSVNGESIDEPYVPESYRVDEDRAPLVVRRGYYYVLGDHRSKSYDSRLWGLVPQRYIYGKVVFAYWPPNHAGFIAP